ncbi:MAG TPA: hypothetical protein VKU77_29110 [Streptosporangiaceae bacterium]|nr:hypothetical protein [Streptosporangiaceae bacterium]
MKLLTLTNKDPRFYPLLGPFLASRDVVTYLGGHMWDDDAKTWTVAVGAGGVGGFIATVPGRGAVRAQSCYAVPGSEGDVIPALIGAVIAAHAPSPLIAVVRADHAGPWLEAGFEVVADKGRFTHLARKGG